MAKEVYFDGPPFDYSPGLAEFLVKGRFSRDSFIATIFRLEDKGVVGVECFGRKFFLTLKDRDTSGLSVSEHVVLNFIGEWVVRENRRFSLHELRHMLYRRYRGFWHMFEDALMIEFHEEGFTRLRQMSFVDRLGRPSLVLMCVGQFVLFFAAFMFFNLVFGSVLVLEQMGLSFLSQSNPSLHHFSLDLLFLAVLYIIFVLSLLGFVVSQPIILLFAFQYFLVNHLLIFCGEYSLLRYQAWLWFKLSLRMSFTVKAREHRETWLRFSKFITDYSLMRKEPARRHEFRGPLYTYALVTGVAELE